MNDDLEQRLRSSLRGAPLPPAPDALYARLGDLTASRARPQRFVRLRLGWVLISVAGLLIVLLGGLAFGIGGPRPTPSPSVSPTTCVAAAALYEGTIAGAFVSTIGAIRGVPAVADNPQLSGFTADQVATLCYVDGRIPKGPLPNDSAATVPPSFDRAVLVAVDGDLIFIAAGYRDQLPVIGPRDQAETLPLGWPVGSPPPGFEAATRATCAQMLSADLPRLPLVVADYIEWNFTIYRAAIFGNDTMTDACDFQTTPAGAAGGNGSGGVDGPRWTTQEATVKGRAGLTLEVGDAAMQRLDWNTAMGLVPPSAKAIRMVVGDRAAAAVIADGFYIVAWQGPIAPSALVAWDAQGNEIDRIDQSALGQIYHQAATASPFYWSRVTTGAEPGPVVVGMIANALGVPSGDVTAAVFMFEQAAGNKPWIWVFRARGVTSQAAIERWVAFETKCPVAPSSTTINGLPTTVTTRHLVDQCQPEYLVALDGQTVALLVDDGGYPGNAAGAATPVPYRPVSEIAQLVTWLQENLPRTPLMTGGPVPLNRP